MDDKTFDSLLKLSVTPSGRRRLLQATAAVGLGSLLTRGGEAMAQVVVEACQRTGSSCTRDRQCECKSTKVVRVACARLPRGCNTGTRCCGIAGADCRNNCQCCRGYTCNQNGKCQNN